MRTASWLILLALVGSCAEPNDGPTIIVDNPQSIPFVPPQVTALGIGGPGGRPVGAVRIRSSWAMLGKSLNLKLDLSDSPGISLTRTRDLTGAAAPGPALPVDSVHPLGVQNGTGLGEVDFVFTPPETGIYDLKVTTAAGSTTLVDAMIIAPQLEVTPLPDALFFCGSDPVAIALDGTFTQLPAIGSIGTQLSYVDTAGNKLANSDSWPVQLEGCTTVPFDPYPGVQVCHRATITPNPTQQHAVVQLNGFFGLSPRFDVFFEFSPPVETGGPLQIYSAAPVPVSLRFDSGAIVESNAGPAVTLDGAPIPSSTVNCGPSGFAGKQLCSTVQTAVPQGTPPGLHTLTATSLFGCTTSARYEVHAPPAITSVTPSLICRDSSITLSGTDFGSPTVLMDGQPTFAVCDGGSCSLPSFSLSPGAHQLAVRGGFDVALDSPPVTVTVHPGPLSFTSQPSPETFLAGAGRTLFIGVAGQEGALVSAEFRENLLDGGVVSVPFEEVDGGVVVTTPADAGPGRYALGMEDEGACQPSQTLAVVDLAASPATYDIDFTAGTDNVQFGSVAPNGGFSADTIVSPTQQGNPGGAIFVQIPAGMSPHYFMRAIVQVGNDLGSIQFDLSTCTSGGTLRGDVVQIVASDPLTGDGFLLTHPIDAPQSCTFTHYDLPLDATWTRNDAAGARPATRDDFDHEIDEVRIPGVFSDAAGITFLDNVIVDLAQ